MDLVAGAGSVFGQLAVGLAGGMGAQDGQGGAMMANGLFKMSGAAGRMGAPKPTVDALPDKVIHKGLCLLSRHCFRGCLLVGAAEDLLLSVSSRNPAQCTRMQKVAHDLTGKGFRH